APGQEVAALAQLEGDEYRTGLRRFLDRHGYRGANEWEIAAPPWELVPDAVEHMVDAARKAPPKPDTAERAAEARDRIMRDGAERRWPEVAFWLPKAEFYVANRERTKATAVLLFNELRLDLFELGRHLTATGELADPIDVGRLTIDEVRGAAATGRVPSGAV